MSTLAAADSREHMSQHAAEAGFIQEGLGVSWWAWQQLCGALL